MQRAFTFYFPLLLASTSCYAVGKPVTTAPRELPNCPYVPPPVCISPQTVKYEFNQTTQCYVPFCYESIDKRNQCDCRMLPSYECTTNQKCNADEMEIEMGSGCCCPKYTVCVKKPPRSNATISQGTSTTSSVSSPTTSPIDVFILDGSMVPPAPRESKDCPYVPVPKCPELQYVQYEFNQTTQCYNPFCEKGSNLENQCDCMMLPSYECTPNQKCNADEMEIEMGDGCCCPKYTVCVKRA